MYILYVLILWYIFKNVALILHQKEISKYRPRFQKVYKKYIKILF